MDFQKTILEIRTKNALTQDEFAEKLHVTRQAVSRWENGETTPAIDTLKSIAEVFKVDANVLLGTTSQVCQSCSMHLTDIADLGTNADEGVSLEYCAHCYKNGKFIGYASLEEAIADSVNYAEVAGMTKEAMLEYAKATLPTLKRWKTN
jgi:transcriptional regulator with XRE-family HTH domain